MDCRIILVFIFFFRVFNELFAVNPGICSNLSEDITCCQNYHKNGNLCIACPPGTYGSNCTETCPHGFYGYFCKWECNCHQCDKVSGCAEEVSTLSEKIYLPSIGVLSLVVCLLIAYIIRLKCQIKHFQPAGGSDAPVVVQYDYDSLQRLKDGQSIASQNLDKHDNDTELNL
ncbi:scavenger receptor class F member 2-like [Saccostrea cucullata]|uniref:scavenger receptor class F member 2-like n=1 Tax=Saccostrea cuccullata TaxID=36930 RepID=UPI002ED1E79C